MTSEQQSALDFDPNKLAVWSVILAVALTMLAGQVDALVAAAPVYDANAEMQASYKKRMTKLKEAGGLIKEAVTA